MKNKRQSILTKNKWLICGIFCAVFILSGSLSLFAENKNSKLPRGQLYSNSVIKNEEKTQKKSMEEIDSCVAKFDIKKMHPNNPILMRYSELLAEYFNCLAVVKDDVNICNNLASSPEAMSNCKKNFYDTYGFLSRLSKANQVDSKVLSYCSNFGLTNKEKCQRFAEAFLNSDASYCNKSDMDSNSDNCRAILMGETNLCKTEMCSDQATYVKALRTKESYRCEGISQSSIKSICKGSITGEFACKENPTYKQFVTIYCAETQQTEGDKHEKEQK